MALLLGRDALPAGGPRPGEREALPGLRRSSLFKRRDVGGAGGMQGSVCGKVYNTGDGDGASFSAASRPSLRQWPGQGGLRRRAMHYAPLQRLQVSAKAVKLRERHCTLKRLRALGVALKTATKQLNQPQTLIPLASVSPAPLFTAYGLIIMYIHTRAHTLRVCR